MNEIHTVDMNKVYTDSELIALGKVLDAALEALKATCALAHSNAVEQEDVLSEDQG